MFVFYSYGTDRHIGNTTVLSTRLRADENLYSGFRIPGEIYEKFVDIDTSRFVFLKGFISNNFVSEHG